MNSPIFRALFDLNIIWKSKYYENFTIEHYLYIGVIDEWLQRRKQGMNKYERILYWLFKKQHEVKLSKRRSGVGKVAPLSMSKGHAYKAEARWELHELYFEEVTDDKPRFDSSARTGTAASDLTAPTEISGSSSKV